METDSGVVDKNLYAYCDGNPVMRKDNGGDFWNVVIGATLDAAIEIGYQMVVEKKSWSQVSWVDVGASAISGGLAATGLGLFGQAVANGIVSGTSSYIKGDRGMSLVVSAGLGILSGAIGGKGANYKGAISDVQKLAKKKLAKEDRRAYIKYAEKSAKRWTKYKHSNYRRVALTAGGRYIFGFAFNKYLSSRK